MSENDEKIYMKATQNKRVDPKPQSSGPAGNDVRSNQASISAPTGHEGMAKESDPRSSAVPVRLKGVLLPLVCQSLVAILMRKPAPSSHCQVPHQLELTAATDRLLAHSSQHANTAHR